MKKAWKQVFAPKNFKFNNAIEFERFVVESELWASLEKARKIDSISWAKAYRLIDGKIPNLLLEAKKGYERSFIDKKQLKDYILYGNRYWCKVQYYFSNEAGARNNLSIFKSMRKDGDIGDEVGKLLRIFYYDASWVKHELLF